MHLHLSHARCLINVKTTTESVHTLPLEQPGGRVLTQKLTDPASPLIAAVPAHSAGVRNPA